MNLGEGPQMVFAHYRELVKPKDAERYSEIRPAAQAGTSLRLKRRQRRFAHMSYLTLEVEIDRGRVVAKEPGRLPEKGSGLLTILQSGESDQPRLSPLQALDALQQHLKLDAEKAAEWMDTVRDAKR